MPHTSPDEFIQKFKSPIFRAIVENFITPLVYYPHETGGNCAVLSWLCTKYTNQGSYPLCHLTLTHVGEILDLQMVCFWTLQTNSICCFQVGLWKIFIMINYNDELVSVTSEYPQDGDSVCYCYDYPVDAQLQNCVLRCVLRVSRCIMSDACHAEWEYPHDGGCGEKDWRPL